MTQGDPDRALTSHPRIANALKSFGIGADRHVVVIPGNYDGALGWHPRAIEAVVEGCGAKVRPRLGTSIRGV